MSSFLVIVSHPTTRISSTDHMLEHLQAFSSEPMYYQTPESICKGVPLYTFQQEGPSVNMQLSASSMEKFAAFWKGVILLDTNNWYVYTEGNYIETTIELDTTKHISELFIANALRPLRPKTYFQMYNSGL